MKQELKKLAIPFLSGAVGGLVTFAALKTYTATENSFTKINKDTNIESPLRQDDFFDSSFEKFFDRDFFSHSKKMRDQIEPFNLESTYKFTDADISKREDDKYVYYDLKVSDLKATTINTKINGGYITITGTLEKRSEESESEKSFFKSSFNRTFPLPAQVDQHNMEMISEKDKIVLKFPKLKA